MSVSPSPRLQAALVEGRYTIRQKLGSGSLGTVYLAWDEEAKRLVALKIIRTEQLIPEGSTSMQDEFRAFALVQHPRIARAYDFGYTGAGIPYYTREYIAGSPLPSGPPGKEPPGKFLRPVLDLLESLEYLHSQGVLHLDIHAGNLIVAEDEARGSVLIDFGLVRSLDKPLFSSQGGSWASLPPELLENKGASPRTDLFLVGRLLHYRLTGRTQGKPSLPREIPGWGTRLTLDLERAIAKALQPSPEARFPSAADFRRALCRILGEEEKGLIAAEPGQSIFGRGAELEAIEEALRAAGQGSPGLLWLVSKTGLGKTRLVAEARLRAQLRGFQTVEVRFLPDSGPEPALFQALRSVKARSKAFAAWLDALDPSCGGTPLERAQRAAQAYFRGEEKPLVLLLDDLDRADRQSRDLAEALAAECVRRQKAGIRSRGMALIVTSSEAPPRRLIPRGGETRVRALRPLDVGTGRDLLQDLLRPLEAPAPLVKKAVRAAGGSPLHLRQIAMSLRIQWGQRPSVPAAAELPAIASSPPGAGFQGWESLSSEDRQVLETLAVLSRAATGEELAAVLDLPGETIARSLRRLAKLDVLLSQGHHRARRYQIAQPEAGRRLAGRIPPRRARKIHEAMAVFLQRAIASRGAERDARVHESLARHLLAAGRGREGYPLAIEAAGLLRRSGSFERSVKLLEEYAAREEDPARRLALAEETCSVLSECGDHEKGISVLEPFYRGGHGRLPRAGKVRILRRLGMHYHGADRAAEALRVFKEAQDAAEPERDLEDLLFIDSELAELHIFLGSHDAAEEACRRGLERIETASRREEVHGRMEVLLRASLGHIEMRRLRLREAREELLKALSLSRNYRMEGERAGILHNLGVTENELNRFSSARRYFAEAEKLLLKAGRQRDVIKICTNLALIEAKLGRKDEAEEELARAEEMLRHYPGQRLECFAAFSRGLVAHLYGETESAIDALEHSAALARALGDNSLRSFGLLYLSEAYLLSGRYAKALSLLNSTLKTLAEQPSPVLERMAHCRLHLTETLLGRRQRAVAAQRKLELIPRTGVLYLETWNDLLLAFCREVSGEDAAPLLEDVMGVFRRLKFVPGVRLAKLLLLGGALRREDRDAINARARGLEEEGDSPHCFLRVAEPLAAAEGRFFLGDDEKAEKWLGAASSAIVGAPFLELDGRIELMRTRLALRGGDLREARRHLHRCLHCRDLLLQFVPEEARRRFTEAPRFETLRQAIARLSISPAVEFSTERLRKSQVYEGMVGRSEAMLSLFRSLERIRDQGLSVLIAGETGTGKDLVARAIHSRSPRHERPFQSLSCACLPPELFESELFGHAAGAFTGAESDQPGILEQVEGGTLLLDQVALLPQECQAKLLRVLDSGAVRPLGSTAERRVDVRYLATASTDLRRAVEAGVFRADLYYRLAGVEIRVPPLRERKGDISLLARHFLERHAASLDRAVPVLTSDAVSLLEARDWPGNVRELETFLLRACIHLSDLEHITARYLESLGSEAREPARRRDLLTRSLEDWRRDLERDYLIQLFQKLGGNTRRMAEELHVGTTKLYSWFRDLGIDVRKLRAEGQREVQ